MQRMPSTSTVKLPVWPPQLTVAPSAPNPISQPLSLSSETPRTSIRRRSADNGAGSRINFLMLMKIHRTMQRCLEGCSPALGWKVQSLPPRCGSPGAPLRPCRLDDCPGRCSSAHRQLSRFGRRWQKHRSSTLAGMRLPFASRVSSMLMNSVHPKVNNAVIMEIADSLAHKTPHILQLHLLSKYRLSVTMVTTI